MRGAFDLGFKTSRGTSVRSIPESHPQSILGMSPVEGVAMPVREAVAHYHELHALRDRKSIEIRRKPESGERGRVAEEAE
jgi:hypothetical protein